MLMPDRPYLALIDHETSGNRCDATPLFADYAAFSALVDEWIETGVQVGAASSRASPACTSTTTNGRSRCGRATDVFRPRRICRCYNQAALQ